MEGEGVKLPSSKGRINEKGGGRLLGWLLAKVEQAKPKESEGSVGGF